MNMRRTPLPHGFTLVEVLVALSMLSLLMLALTSAVRGMGQAEARVEQRIESGEDWRLAQSLLRQTLAQTSARTFRPLQADAGRAVPFFFGTQSELRWIGVLPARYGVGGRHYLRLGLEEGADGQSRWTLRYAPFTGANFFDDWGSAAVQPLAAQPLAIALSYLDALDGQWHADWPPPTGLQDAPRTNAQLLPDAVRIDFAGAAPPWPPMLLAVRPTWGSGGGGGGIGSFGGRRRQ